MTSEKITIYRTSEDKSETIAQYPTTVSSQVYDEETLKPITQQFEEVTTQLAQIAYNVKTSGAAFDGVNPANDTTLIQTFVDSLPINSILMFPQGENYIINTLVFNKPIKLVLTGATLTQHSSAENTTFIIINGHNSTIEGGDLVVNTSSKGIISFGDNTEINNTTINGARYAFETQGDNSIINNCTSLNAGYAAYRINLITGNKKKTITLNNFKAFDFAVKGITMNGTVGAEEVFINNATLVTRSTDAASDCLLFDSGTGNEGNYYIDRLIVNNCYLWGGESNNAKIYNVKYLEMNTIYANNEHSSYNSSAAFRLYTLESKLNNIQTYNRITVAKKIHIDKWDYLAQTLNRSHVLELHDNGDVCVLKSFDMSKSTNTISNSIIKVDRNVGVQHKIILDGFVGRVGVKPITHFTTPPDMVGYIEIHGRFDLGTTLTANSVTGSGESDKKIKRQPNTFRANSLPTTGIWKQGDVIYNLIPTAGGNLGWVCVTGGDFATSPPVFKTFGTIGT